jgi:hypothetical protein
MIGRERNFLLSLNAFEARKSLKIMEQTLLGQECKK